MLLTKINRKEKVSYCKTYTVLFHAFLSDSFRQSCPLLVHTHFFIAFLAQFLEPVLHIYYA